MSTYTTPLKSTRSIATIGNSNREKAESQKTSQPTNSDYTEKATDLRLSAQAKNSLGRSSYLANDPNALAGFDGSHAQDLSQLQESFSANLSTSNLGEVNVGAKDKGPQSKPFTIGSAALSALQTAPLDKLSSVKTAQTPTSPGKQGLEKALSKETAIASKADTPKTLEDVNISNPADLSAVSIDPNVKSTESINNDAIGVSSGIAAPKSQISPGREGLEKALQKDEALASSQTGDTKTLEDATTMGASDLSSVSIDQNAKQTESVNQDVIGVSNDVAVANSPISPGREGLEKALQKDETLASTQTQSTKTLEDATTMGASDLSSVSIDPNAKQTESVNQDVIGVSNEVAVANTPISPGREGLEKALQKEQAIASANPNTHVDSQPKPIESNLKNVDFTVAEEAEVKSLNQAAIGVHAAVEVVKTPESPGQQGLKEALEQPNSIESKNEVGSKIGKDALDATIEV